jgi:hypothetical protein
MRGIEPSGLGKKAFRYRIYPEWKLGVVVWNERVTGNDVAEAVETLFGADEWQPGFSHIWDGRRMADFSLDLPGAYKVATKLQKLHARVGYGRSAIVVFRDFHVMGVQVLVALANMEDREVQYFPGIEQATAWLGVPLEVVQI